MLVIENLRKEFKNIVAVDDISFKVVPGAIFGLLGPNGAGKTTTIRIILNIIKPTSGKVSFQDSPVSSSIYNKAGYLPEERGLYRKSKVIDVITYMARLKNLSSAQTAERSSQWLKTMNIYEYRERKIEELSKGNQQKVQFITSVIHDPDILVLDEPFAGFDPINQQIIRENILRLSKEGKIIILSTHQMEIAEKLCEEIILINRGKEVLQGNIPSIKQKFGNNFVKVGFSGSPEKFINNSMIEHVDCYTGYAEIQLRNNIHPSTFLREISVSTDILHFSVIEPTLNKIFIDAVKGSLN
jgi:ABC-2 type transport system ATP-binding protein